MESPIISADVAADLLTLPSEQRDFGDWRHGRRHYAVWALDVDLAPVRALSAVGCRAIADFLLPGYCRQPHVTVALCGFPAARATLADDYPLARLLAEVDALRRARLPEFAIEIGAPASFSSAAYFAVSDPEGGIAALRRLLADDAADAGLAYLPHVSFALYRGEFSFAAMLARLAALDCGEPLRLPVARLVLMSYEAAVIGGRLTPVAAHELGRAAFTVLDAARMTDFFGTAWQGAGFAGK